MIIRYQTTEKIGDHSTTSILTVKDADQSSLDKVLKYFEPQVSQQEIAIQSQQPQPQPKSEPMNVDIAREVVTNELVRKYNESDEGKSLNGGQVIKKAQIVQGPKKTVPLTGSMKGAFSIGELLGKSTEEPKENPNIRTTEDGLRLYRTKWTCPGCGSKADRFNADTNDYVKCRQCGTKSELQPSTDRFLEEDKDGYLFHADKPLEV